MKTDTSLDLSLLVDLDSEPACEGGGHRYPRNGHIAGQSATYIMNTLCPECSSTYTLLQCSGRVRYLEARMESGRMHCSDCRYAAPTYMFSPKFTKL